MKTDIEIAQEAVMEPIVKVAQKLGIKEDELELYGKYKAKISEEYMNSIKGNPDGKLVLVTAINPTPAGEGKTTTSVGLGEAFGKLGKKAFWKEAGEKGACYCRAVYGLVFAGALAWRKVDLYYGLWFVSCPAYEPCCGGGAGG